MWLVRTVEEGAQEWALGKATGREQWCQCPVLLGSSDKGSYPGCTTNIPDCSSSPRREAEGAVLGPQGREWKLDC